MDPRTEKINIAAKFISERIGERTPVAGIVLGSGLGKLAEKIADPVVIPYKTVPGFPEFPEVQSMSLRNRPVQLFAFFATCSGVP